MNPSNHPALQFYKCYVVQVHSGSGARFLSLGKRSGLLALMHIVTIAALPDLNFDLWASFMLSEMDKDRVTRGQRGGKDRRKMLRVNRRLLYVH